MNSPGMQPRSETFMGGVRRSWLISLTNAEAANCCREAGVANTPNADAPANVTRPEPSVPDVTPAKLIDEPLSATIDTTVDESTATT